MTFKDKFKKFFGSEPKTESNNLLKNKLNEQSFRSPDHLFKAMAKEAGYATPFHVFGYDKNKAEVSFSTEKRDQFLLEYVRQAVKNFDPAVGDNRLSVAETLAKYEYAAKVSNHVPVNKGQAPGEVVISLSTRINLTRMLEGEDRIIENGVLLNGTFGHRGAATDFDQLNIGTLMADLAYLIDHSQEAELPLPTSIFITGKAYGKEDFEKARQVVTEFRNMLSACDPGFENAGRNYSVDDDVHAYSAKFRVVCLVFDMSKGELMVVSSDHNLEPVRYTDWAQRIGDNSKVDGLCELLSASAKDIQRFGEWAEKIGLEKMLREPKLGDQPWKTLLSSLDKLTAEADSNSQYADWMAIMKDPFEAKANRYKLANKIWGYAMLKRQCRNIEAFEKEWKNVWEIDKLRQAIMRIGCDDGREECDIAEFAGILTKKEFFHHLEHLTDEDGPMLKKFDFFSHEGCGFVGDMMAFVKGFARLREMIESDYDEEKEIFGLDHARRERQKRIDYFSERLMLIIGSGESTDYSLGPVAMKLRFESRLPSALADEYRIYRGVYLEEDKKVRTAPLNKANHELTMFMHALFVGNPQKSRMALKRAADNEHKVIEFDQSNFVLKMPALDNVRNQMHQVLDNEKDIERVENSGGMRTLVTEELNRLVSARYGEWLKEWNDLHPDKRVELASMFETFSTGQRIEIPPRPSSAKEYLEPVRYDYVVKNSFTYDEIQAYKQQGVDLEAIETWQPYKMQ